MANDEKHQETADAWTSAMPSPPQWAAAIAHDDQSVRGLGDPLPSGVNHVQSPSPPQVHVHIHQSPAGQPPSSTTPNDQKSQADSGTLSSTPSRSARPAMALPRAINNNIEMKWNRIEQFADPSNTALSPPGTRWALVVGAVKASSVTRDNPMDRLKAVEMKLMIGLPGDLGVEVASFSTVLRTHRRNTYSKYDRPFWDRHAAAWKKMTTRNIDQSLAMDAVDKFIGSVCLQCPPHTQLFILSMDAVESLSLINESLGHAGMNPLNCHRVTADMIPCIDVKSLIAMDVIRRRNRSIPSMSGPNSPQSVAPDATGARTRPSNIGLMCTDTWNAFVGLERADMEAASVGVVGVRLTPNGTQTVPINSAPVIITNPLQTNTVATTATFVPCMQQ